MRFQFSLRELLALVVFVAVGCAGLAQPSPFMASVVFTLMVSILFVAILAAVAKSPSSRFFWIGFAIAGWGYLWVAHWPDEDSYMAVPQYELQTSGPLLTTKLLDWAFTALHPPPPQERRGMGGGGMGGGGFMSVPPGDLDHGLPLPLAQMGGMGGMSGSSGRVTLTGPPYEVMHSAFLRIGHSLWTLLFAYLGGRLTQHFYRTRRE